MEGLNPDSMAVVQIRLEVLSIICEKRDSDSRPNAVLWRLLW